MAAPMANSRSLKVSKLFHCLYRIRSLGQSKVYSGPLQNTSSNRRSALFENRRQNTAYVSQRNMSVFTSSFSNRVLLMHSRLSTRLTNYSTMSFVKHVKPVNNINSAHNQGGIFPLQRQRPHFTTCISFVGRLCCHTQRGYCNAPSIITGTCWNCNAQVKVVDRSMVQFFCKVCNAIQPVHHEANYFQVLNCEVTFDLYPAQLTQTFRNLQRQLHPDKFSIKTKEEQEFSAEQSSQVNKAYSTLLKPLPRGLYLLELNGLTIEEGDAGIEPEFLMEVMEINEELADTRNEDTVRRIGKENAVKLESLLKDLSEAFSKKEYSTAREILMRLKYFANIDDKVREHLEKHSS